MRYEKIGTGPAVVLVPGLGCDGRMWGSVARDMEGRFTLILPETWNCGSLHEAAEGIRSVLRELKIPSAGVAGLSMGGYITFELLRHWPEKVRAAALFDTTAYPDTPEREETRHAVLRLIREGGYEDVLENFARSALAPAHALGGNARDRLLEMARALGPEAFANDVEAILKRESYEDVLRLVRIPLLIAAGEHDALTPPQVARRMAAEIPGARLEVIPDAGHMTPLENPAHVARVLSRFFDAAFGATLIPAGVSHLTA